MAIAIVADATAVHAEPHVEVYESHYLGSQEKAVGWVLIVLAILFWSFVASSTVAGILGL